MVRHDSCRAELHLVVQTGINEVPGCSVVPSCGQRRDEFRQVRPSLDQLVPCAGVAEYPLWVLFKSDASVTQPFRADVFLLAAEVCSIQRSPCLMSAVHRNILNCDQRATLAL